MAASTINVILGLSSAQFEKNIRKVQRQMTQVAKQLEQVGKSMSTYVTAPVIAMGAASVAAFDKQAKAVAQVEAGLKSTGDQVGYTSSELQKMASELQKISLFGDEEILQGVTAQLLTFTNIAGKEFERTQKAALDLATRLDGDLKSASIQLGKALNDPIANLSALSRSGIQFSADQKNLIKSLWETGQTAEAQSVILTELEKQYGGSAEAAAKAGAGPIKQLQNAIGDLSETFGELIATYLVPLAEKLKTAVEGFQSLSVENRKQIIQNALIAAAIGPVVLIISKLILVTKALIGVYLFLSKTFMRLIAALPALRTAFIAFNVTIAAQTTLLGKARVAMTALNLVISRNPIGALLSVLALVASSLLIFRNRSDDAAESQDKLKESIQGVSAELGKLSYQSLVIGLERGTNGMYEFTGSIERLREQLPKLTTNELKSLQLFLQEAIPEATRRVANATDDIFGEVAQNELDSYKQALSLIEQELSKLEQPIGKVSKESNNLLKGIASLQSLASKGFRLIKTENIVNIEKANQQVYDLIDKFKKLKGEMRDMPKIEAFDDTGFADRWVDATKRIEDSINAAIATAISGSALILGEMLAMGAGFDEFGKNIGIFLLETLANLAQQVGELAIATGIAVEGIRDALLSLNPVIAIAAGVALVALAGFVRGKMKNMGEQPTAFAEGGIVSGPTNALIGEYSGARNNPEVVAPLDKLTAILANSLGSMGLVPSQMALAGSVSGGYGGGSERSTVAVQVEGIIKGKDIYLSNKRYNNNINRTT